MTSDGRENKQVMTWHDRACICACVVLMQACCKWRVDSTSQRRPSTRCASLPAMVCTPPASPSTSLCTSRTTTTSSSSLYRSTCSTSLRTQCPASQSAASRRFSLLSDTKRRRHGQPTRSRRAGRAPRSASTTRTEYSHSPARWTMKRLV